MKKTIIIALALLGMQLSATAQDTPTPPSNVQITTKRDKEVSLYVGFGVNVLGDFKMNDRLKASGMPQIASAAPEITVGLNVLPSDSRFLSDVEFSTAYMDDRTPTDRIKTTVLSSRLRVQYRLVNTQSLYFAGGLDLGYSQTLINLYSRSNVIDLNDLDTSRPGVITMNSGQLTVGPSVALGLFQNKNFPIRINAGYNIGVTNGKWKSEFAQVNNTVKEMGLGSFYARVCIGF
jgi:hypothetical protein